MNHLRERLVRRLLPSAHCVMCTRWGRTRWRVYGPWRVSFGTKWCGTPEKAWEAALRKITTRHDRWTERDPHRVALSL